MKTPMDMCKSGTEFGEQSALIQWVRYQSKREALLDLLIAIPNGGERGKAAAAKAKAEGVRPGVSDLFLPVPRHGHHGLWLEMKRHIGGRESDEQKEWARLMREQGYAYVCCHGWQSAASALLQWLEIEESPWPDGICYATKAERYAH